jgi:ankyrin repeat protein
VCGRVQHGGLGAVSMRDTSGATALACAVASGNIATFEAVLGAAMAHGGEPHAADEEGLTPLHEASSLASPGAPGCLHAVPASLSPPRLFAHRRWPRCMGAYSPPPSPPCCAGMVRALLEASADPSAAAPGSGMTALHCAAAERRRGVEAVHAAECAELLLQHGGGGRSGGGRGAVAKMRTTGAVGRTALELALGARVPAVAAAILVSDGSGRHVDSLREAGRTMAHQGGRASERSPP